MRLVRLVSMTAVVVGLLAVVLGVNPDNTGAAQQIETTCPALIEDALTTVGDNCGGLERNSACYGFNNVLARFTEPQPDGFFNEPSDRSSVQLIAALNTSPLNRVTNEWGISLLSLQANLPDTIPGRSVIFMLLGDMEVENAVDPATARQPIAAPLALTTTMAAVLFEDPEATARQLTPIPAGTALLADAISTDGAWARVAYRDLPGWVETARVTAPAPVQTLPIVDADTRTTMQAFYFRNGINRRECREAPRTLVVQGPEGIAIDINPNGANVRLASTILLNTLPLTPALQEKIAQNYDGPEVVNALMELIVLDGGAVLDRGTPSELVVPAGFRTYGCLAIPDDLGLDGDANDETVITGCPWFPLEPLTAEEIAEYAALEGFTLNYPITLPELQLVTATPTGTSTATPIIVDGVIVLPFATNTPTVTGTLTATATLPPGVTATFTPTFTETPIPPTPIPPTPIPPTQVPPACPPIDFNIPVPPADAALLIAYIDAANDEVCFPGKQTIFLDGNADDDDSYVFADAFSGTDNALPQIASEIVIVGKQSNLDVESGEIRLFQVTAVGNLTLSNLTLYGGNLTSKNGGCIFNDGALTLDRVTITDCFAAFGGGLFNNGGTVTITGSSLEANEASTNGGAIYNIGSVFITQSAIAGNSANANGAGIYNFFDGAVSMINVTISRNSASIGAGGLHNFGSVEANFVTLAQNSGGGAAIFTGGTVVLHNSLVAINAAPACTIITGGGITNSGVNRGDDTSCGIPVFSSSAINIDFLADNGGGTLTNAIIPPSAAIDVAPCTKFNGDTVDVDQRGKPRPFDSDAFITSTDCDAGAFESEKFSIFRLLPETDDTIGESELTPEVTPDPEVTPEITPDPELTPEVTPDPEATPEITPDPETTPEVTPDPELTPEVTPDPEPTSEPTAESTVEITAEPTITPTSEPTATEFIAATAELTPPGESLDPILPGGGIRDLSERLWSRALGKR